MIIDFTQFYNIDRKKNIHIYEDKVLEYKHILEPLLVYSTKKVEDIKHEYIQLLVQRFSSLSNITSENIHIHSNKIEFVELDTTILFSNDNKDKNIFSDFTMSIESDEIIPSVTLDVLKINFCDIQRLHTTLDVNIKINSQLTENVTKINKFYQVVDNSLMLKWNDSHKSDSSYRNKKTLIVDRKRYDTDTLMQFLIDTFSVN